MPNLKCLICLWLVLLIWKYENNTNNKKKILNSLGLEIIKTITWFDWYLGNEDPMVQSQVWFLLLQEPLWFEYAKKIKIKKYLFFEEVNFLKI